MPFKSVKKLLKGDKDKESPKKKPILDDTPKEVDKDVYNLPTLDDLPEMPEPLEQSPRDPYSDDEHQPHPDVASMQNIPRPQPREQPPEPNQPSRAPIPEPRPLPEPTQPQPQEPASNDRVLDALDRIERRMMDLDRRLALIERSLG